MNRIYLIKEEKGALQGRARLSNRRQAMTDQQSMINIENLTRQLEPIIRRIIREELTNLLKDVPGLFYLNPEMPLHKDMEELGQKKNRRSDQTSFA